MLGNFVRPLRERIDRNSSEPSKKEMTMKTTKKISGIKVIANIKAGSWNPNHVRAGLKVTSSVNAGGNWSRNHNLAALVVLSA